MSTDTTPAAAVLADPEEDSRRPAPVDPASTVVGAGPGEAAGTPAAAAEPDPDAPPPATPAAVRTPGRAQSADPVAVRGPAPAAAPAAEREPRSAAGRGWASARRLRAGGRTAE
ncbi:hypothetical protein ACFV9H_41150, partial [Streptomyces sp. NPDC059874]